jgi:adenosylmethionine-8-amino-7-oxononanoate aminotransferase
VTSSPTRTDWERLAALDSERVWHPYGALPAPAPSLPVSGAQGVGYRHPQLDRAVTEQLQRMAHVMFGGLTHEPAIGLAERLLEISPDALQRVFFADSGSVSVEVAIKMALQYQRALGKPTRRRLLTIRGGYHGDTFGAMAVCDPVGGMHSLFAGTLTEHVFAERPMSGFAADIDERWVADVARLAERYEQELAAVILEPIVQGAGGMHFYSPAYVSELRRVCDRHGLLLIFDEIATGFGRTGTLFACEHANVSPDIMCLGKALTGGYMTLAATLCTAAIAEAVSRGEGGGLMHGPTFMANPLACAAALASLQLLEDGAWKTQVPRIQRLLEQHLAPARELPAVTDVRVLGAIGVVQLETEVDIPQATAAAIERGVWLRPFRDLIYTMPAYLMDEEDVATVAAAVVDAARACSASR